MNIRTHNKIGSWQTEACSKTRTFRAETVVEKTQIPEAGWLAFFKDLDGNIHGLWQYDKNA